MSPAALLLAALAAAPAPLPVLELPATGDLLIPAEGSALLHVPGLERFASTAPSQIEREAAGPDRVRLLARGPAGAKVELWAAGKSLSVQVFARWGQAASDFAAVEHLPLTHSEVRIRFTQEVLVLEGALGSLAHLYPNVHILAHASEKLAADQLRAAQSDLGRLSITGLRLERVGKRFMVTGTAANTAEAEAVQGVYQARLEPLDPFL